MDQHNIVKKGAANYLFKLLLQRVIGFVLFIAASGTVKSVRGVKRWDKVLLPAYVLLAYFGIYFLAGLGIRFLWPP
jgi:hypothetical protein